jgi:signal transduction histidine kinase
MIGSTIKDSYESQEQLVNEVLKNKALAIFDLVVDMRHWNAQFNGVYALTDLIEPNPYLDPSYIKSDKNETLIWINPAFMTRQISNIASQRDGFTLKITSNKLINKHNAPNDYEKKILTYFEENPDVPYHWERENDEFKFIGALKVEKECMQCHKRQGYKVGDVRGGISVSFNTKKELQQLHKINEDKEYGMIFLVIAAIGTLMTFFTHQSLKRADEKKISDLNHTLEMKVNELDKFNRTLHNMVQEEVKKQREKENLLIQQSKLASLGEMIGNIAHQWRQPISAVSAIMMNIKWTAIANGVEKKFLDERINEANEQLNFMSQTIDDFRNFFKPNKEKEHFDLLKEVKKAQNILEAALQHNNIELKITIGKVITAYGYPNEFSQVVFNLISNAKDVLIERNIQNPKIDIDIYQDDNYTYCVISDNAGGIEEQYIDKIFEPYFTTKDVNGTGIGLYISKEIIHKHMKGTLHVVNTAVGAKFIISLSKNSES